MRDVKEKRQTTTSWGPKNVIYHSLLKVCSSHVTTNLKALKIQDNEILRLSLTFDSLFESIYVSQSLSSRTTSSGYSFTICLVVYCPLLVRETIPAGHQLVDYGQFPSRPRAVIVNLNDISNSDGLRVGTCLTMMFTNCSQVLGAPSPPELTNRVGQYFRAFGDVIMSTAYGVGSRPQGVIAVWQSRYSTAIQKVCWGQRLRIIQVR